ncbi:outer membrane beta-barrel protein [Flavitalea flava]
MMERNFYSDEFEQLIRDKTEQYKMYPSEKVWKGVHGSLHTKRRWFFAGMSLLVTGILFFAGKELIAPSNRTNQGRKMALTGSAASSTNKETQENTPPPGFSAFRANKPSSGPSRHNGQVSDPSSPEESTSKGISITVSDPVISQPDLQLALSHATRSPIEAPSFTRMASKVEIKASVLTEENAPERTGQQENLSVSASSPNDRQSSDKQAFAEKQSNEKQSSGKLFAGRQSDIGRRLTGKQLVDKQIAYYTLSRSLPWEKGTEFNDFVFTKADSRLADARIARTIRNNMAAMKNLAVTRPDAGSVMGSDLLDDSAREMTRKPAPSPEMLDQQRSNWLHDYAVYNLPAATWRRRKAWQLFVAPTVNYRTLSGGDFLMPKSIVENIPVAPVHSGSAKDYVDHTPALGFEVGGNLLYRMTRKLTLRMGLQFNFSRYTIKAYASSPQEATITLSSPYGYYLDSITNLSDIRNFGGKKQETLNNDYYSFSAPIGLEWRILGDGRLQWSVAATVQPTYMLNRNAYLLTTDYNNYTKEPSLFRKWNINGGLETFLSYKIGGIRWQIGPEFRYQLLSTYSSRYPMRENLKGYGLKIGMTKTIR